VSAEEVPFLTSVNLRVDPDSARVAELGLSLPTTPNTVATRGELAALWLGPDEYLIVGPEGVGSELLARLRAGLTGRRSSAVDVSANRTCVELRGAGARAIMEMGCPLDLHPRVFAPGRCAQTVLAKAQIILWQPAQQSYRLLVRCSYAHYLAMWLTDSARP
jgi:sarcosine oxidase subunit gamma